MKDLFWVTLNTPVASVMKIEIYNAGGVRVLSQIAALNDGNNKIGINVKALPPGLYFINLQWDNGHHIKIVKIEKN